MKNLLSGEKVSLDGYLPWLKNTGIPVSRDGKLKIRSTHLNEIGNQFELIYNSESLAVGVGCERGTSVNELISLVQTTLENNNFAKESIAVFVSIEQKMDEIAINAIADFFNKPLRFFDSVTLEEETPRLKNPSEIVFREVGSHGVAEASALAAVGPHGELIVEKTKSRRATCAIAKTKTLIDPNSIGKARGILSVVGLGPGKAEWLTPEAKRCIEDSSDLVGYALYLDCLLYNLRAHET